MYIYFPHSHSSHFKHLHFPIWPDDKNENKNPIQGSVTDTAVIIHPFALFIWFSIWIHIKRVCDKDIQMVLLVSVADLKLFFCVKNVDPLRVDSQGSVICSFSAATDIL